MTRETPDVPERTDDATALPADAAARTPGDVSEESPQPTAVDHGVVEARARRAPRFAVFLVLGAVLGFVVTVIVTALFPSDPQVGFVALAAYFSLYGISAGLVLGGIVALILDRVSRRRARDVSVAHVSVVIPEPEAESADPETSEDSGDTDEAATPESDDPGAGDAGDQPRSS